ncbi:hypothetical protein H7K28_12720 [Paenibacillus polymyxa]|jgi:hypothetical protein|uniref:hypothetical protein n=1 Tax=Paenibacillus TaxID=44249 RepID=UPI000D30BC81|nr:MULTISPECIES: hypothetical protein [Paenibacillus]KAF6616194.1 hypothetical protein HFE00_16865 [Paenibacillus sp. EKM101P]KAF6618028.1 hypothetical protein HFE03_23400 [Paenibacillus sp. EKM102P]KAF6626046.1 hypothetical protein HFE01_23040 [Paenibacillus sp. EKM10P]KAF6642601.1 hypothetical protein HFE02_23405 [Paenibacillus sp. EKM11P]MBY0020934.1 hypothetical protein [Paenibacillus polymyxa]
MFYDTKLEILDAEFISIRSMMADIQPYRKSFLFEDGYTLETTYRAFCPLESLLLSNCYIRIGKDVFIILDMKKWSDYMELYLYRCKADFALEVEK